MSPLRRWTVGLSLALAVLGPLAGLAVLMAGELPLWHAPPMDPLPPGAGARIALGSWATFAGIGLLLAAPARLAAAIGLARERAWAWPVAALAAAAGCLDLSAGFGMLVLTTALWQRERPGAEPQNPVDNSSAQDAKST